ncbi:MAG: hypothetical protein KGS00_06720 [Alphaproteobacteria bacterium]|nr:hypothetical protein [Alphaproteobacteria bacterium]
MKRRHILSLVCVALGGGLVLSALAQSPPAAEAPPAPAAERICKRVTATGSNLPKRVCATAEEWAALDRKGREGAEDFDRQRRESVGVNPVGGS